MTMGYFIVKGDRCGIMGRDNFEFSLEVFLGI